MMVSNTFRLNVIIIGLNILALTQTSSAEEEFNLWAYGTGGIGGFPVYYRNGAAVISNSTSLENSTPVYFTSASTSAGVWTVHANTTVPSNATFTSGQLALPNTTANRQVGIVAESNSTQSVADFFLFGGTATCQRGGDRQALFFASTSGDSDTFPLLWAPSDRNSANLIPVALRNISPGPGSIL